MEKFQHLKYKNYPLQNLAFAILLIAIFLPGCISSFDGWKSSRGNIYNNAFTEFGDIKGNMFWSYPETKTASDLIIDQSSILYYRRGLNEIVAINNANTSAPSLKWNYPIPNNGKVSYSLSMDDDYSVFFASHDDLGSYLNQVRDGQLVWSFKFPGNQFMGGPPLVANGFVYAGTNDGAVYAFDYKHKNLVWVYPAGGYVIRLAMLPASILYIESDNITALDVITNPNGPPVFKWKKPAGDTRGVPPCFSPSFNSLFVASASVGGSRIIEYDPNNGNIKNQYIFNTGDCLNCIHGICANTDRLFVQGNEGITAIPIVPNATGWTKTFQSSPFALPIVDSKGALYVAKQNSIMVLNEKDGTELLPEFMVSPGSGNSNWSMIIGNKTLYVGQVFGTSGKPTVVAFK